MSPQSTLVIILGASDFPESQDGLASSGAFKTAADGMFAYLLDEMLFGLPESNLLWLFNYHGDPNQTDKEIETWLDCRIEVLQGAGVPAKDLILYYVGHGLLDDERNYCLAIRTTRSSNVGVSSIRVRHLGNTLERCARGLRTYFMLDACFSAEAIKDFQASESTLIQQEVDRLPNKGMSLLCSSSSRDVSVILPEKEHTMFSDSLLYVLTTGDRAQHAQLSLRDVHYLVNARIEQMHGRKAIRAELHSPNQPEGDIAIVDLFPNQAVMAARRDEEVKSRRKQSAMLARQRETELEQQQLREDAQRTAEALKRKASETAQKQAIIEAAKKKREAQEGRSIVEIKEEESFRKEAEDPLKRKPDINLLQRWVEWRIWQTEGDIALREAEVGRLKPHRDRAWRDYEAWCEERTEMYEKKENKKWQTAIRVSGEKLAEWAAYEQKIVSLQEDIGRLHVAHGVYRASSEPVTIQSICERIHPEADCPKATCFSQIVFLRVKCGVQGYNRRLRRQKAMKTLRGCLMKVFIASVLIAVILLFGYCVHSLERR